MSLHHFPFFLAFTDGDRWVAGIGDPTFMGWFTVFSYFIAFALCAAVAFRTKKENAGASSRAFTFWVLMTLFMLFLGINKQLDLQTWLTLAARKLAKDEGWYNYRRILQMAFIATISLMSVAGIIFLRWLTKGGSPHKRTALTGAVLLTLFILIRASSFHHVDKFLGVRIGGFKMNWLLELSGIYVIAFAAFKAAREFTLPVSQPPLGQEFA